jgi:hypothetical protein
MVEDSDGNEGSGEGDGRKERQPERVRILHHPRVVTPANLISTPV